MKIYSFFLDAAFSSDKCDNILFCNKRFSLFGTFMYFGKSYQVIYKNYTGPVGSYLNLSALSRFSGAAGWAQWLQEQARHTLGRDPQAQ